MNTLILGGTGFLGKAVALGLAHSGKSVRIYSPSSGNNPTPLGLGIEGFAGSIQDFERVSVHLDWADVVFHFVSNSNPHTISPSFEFDLQWNVSPLLKILENIRGTQKKIVFCSSGGAVYGNSASNVKSENDAIMPINPYGLIKSTMENYVLYFYRNFKLNALILRPGNVYGPKFNTVNKQGIISTLIDNAAQRKSTRIWASLEIQKDYLFIDDFVNAVISLVEVGAHGVFNLGSGIGTSLNQIISLVEAKIGRSVVLERMNPVSHEASFILNINKLTNQINWSPAVTMDSGVKLVLDELTRLKL